MFTLLCFFPEEMPENHYKDVDMMYTITVINTLKHLFIQKYLIQLLVYIQE